MGRKHYYFVLLFFVSLGIGHVGYSAPGDSLKINQCFDHKFNFIQFYQRSDFQQFYEKWNSTSNIVVAHFGDSHIQADIFSGKVRNRLQFLKGTGGLGMIFPYSTAKTYSAIHYASSHTGNWLSAKSIARKPELPLGVTGVTARTNDADASFKIDFKKPLPSSYKKLIIYCKQSKSSYDVILKNGDQEITISVDEPQSPNQPFIEVELSSSPQSLQFQIQKSSDKESEFELYGLSLLSNESDGLVLHAMGVGGSQYGSLLREQLFDAQFPTLRADIAILDFGTNDFMYSNSIPVTLEQEIIEVIKKVRVGSPEGTILLTSTQDMFRKGVNTTAAVEFSDMIRRIARDQKCLFYDWYWVSGGPEKIILWEKAGLAQQDLIHLTVKGYELKGDLFAQALENTINWYEHDLSDSLLIQPDPVILNQAAEIVLVNKSLNGNEKSYKTISHQIEKGETLYGIARKYEVSIADLMTWNELTTNSIRAGDTLNVKLSSEKSVAAAESPKVIRHHIQSGETLSEIAEKYQVSQRSIRKANGLKSSRIIAGKTLIIPPPPNVVNKNS